MALVISLRDPVDLVPQHSFCFRDPVDFGSLKLALSWDPGDLGYYGSWILDFVSLWDPGAPGS